MTQEEFYKQLVHRYVTNEATEEELETFFHLLETGAIDAILEAYLSEEALVMAEKETEVPKRNRLWFRIAVAATVLLATAIGIIGYQSHQKSAMLAALGHIHPGSNKAILILSNGQQIVLNNAKNGQLAIQGNVVINKTADGHVAYQNTGNTGADAGYNTYRTPRGGKFDIQLPDGSRVWLNDTSSIQFPVQFAQNERRIKITGEAYFEVAHDASRPFRVESNGQAVEVLGTHFNINAYPDEANIKTTLLQGSVKVSKGNSTLTLKPGQQAQAYSDDHINLVSDANTEEAIAWKNGYFQFKRADLPAIMRQLSRWYDVDVAYEGTIPHRAFTGAIPRDVNLGDALEILKFFKVNYIIQGRKLTITP